MTTLSKQPANIFILSMIVFITLKIVTKLVDLKKRAICFKCYSSLYKELAALALSLPYVFMINSKPSSAKAGAFYVAIVSSVYIMYELVNFVISKFSKKTPVVIGAEAGASAGVQTGEKTTSVIQAKVTGSVEGGNAASNAAVDHGLSKEETEIAIKAGKETAAIVAEKVVVANKESKSPEIVIA